MGVWVSRGESGSLYSFFFFDLGEEMHVILLILEEWILFVNCDGFDGEVVFDGIEVDLELRIEGAGNCETEK